LKYEILPNYKIAKPKLTTFKLSNTKLPTEKSPTIPNHLLKVKQISKVGNFVSWWFSVKLFGKLSDFELGDFSVCYFSEGNFE